MMADEVLESVFNDIPTYSKSHNRKEQFDVKHFWELKGVCVITTDVCASLEAALLAATHRTYWEIWEVTEGIKYLVKSSPMVKHVTYMQVSKLHN